MTRRRILSYGAGLDSFALLLRAIEVDDLPDAVVFCDVAGSERATDPGEWPGTYRHLTEVVAPLCEAAGIELVEITSPVRDAPSLISWLEARQSVPVSGPTRICTRIAKTERFEQHVAARWPGESIEVWIGFEASELGRVAKDPNNGAGSLARTNRYPLVEWGWCRCRCEAYVRAVGAPVPRKSACVFCPYGSRADWQTFARELPEQFARIVRLEADKPRTKRGEKMAIKGFGKLRVDGTRALALLPEYVAAPGRPRPPPRCEICGATERASKATGCGWLDECREVAA